MVDGERESIHPLFVVPVTGILTMGTGYQFMRKYGDESSRILRSHEYMRDGWQVSLIGVRPDMQGIGIGRALMESVMQKVCSLPHSMIITHYDSSLH